MPWSVGRCLGCLQTGQRTVLTDLDWGEIFKRRPDLAPPGYEEAAAEAAKLTQERYERIGKRRAGKSGKSKRTHFPSLKHGAD